jgi:hypothetical protein
LNAEAGLRNALRARWVAALRDNEAKDARGRSAPPAAAAALEPRAAALPTSPPMPAPGAAREAAAASAAAEKQAATLAVATFADIARTAQGGAINAIAFAELAGDAVHSQLSVRDGELLVTGRFVADAKSTWAGVGVSVNVANAPFNAAAYKTLRIRLSASNAGSLRLRILGSEPGATQSGCYPIAIQAVSSQSRTYDIAFNRFAPESFCGNRGVPVGTAAADMIGVEVADVMDGTGARTVQFGVGSISLLR